MASFSTGFYGQLNRDEILMAGFQLNFIINQVSKTAGNKLLLSLQPGFFFRHHISFLAAEITPAGNCYFGNKST